MHHQDFSGDSPGAGGRKTAFHYRRGSSGASASSAAGSTGAHTADDSQTQTGSSSPALHHQPQSQVSGAQVKKKSGFQITSVTSAQINVSGNNSLADDTESYDDLDESHTEDLSSSDMLDVSMSRATDTGVPERSSSDDTLNSLHGVDTPGIVSPNEPLQPHSTPQVSMVNGTMHHHYYPQQHSQSHHHHSESLGGESALPVAPLASSSPSLASKSGASRSQRTPLLESTKPSGGTTQPLAHIVGVGATDANLQGSGNVSNATLIAGAAVPPPGSAGFDNTSLSGQVASGGGGTGPSIQAQHPQTHAATGSRFRVVKLDTNSEPFRKGRWTCTEFYEKEIPPPAASDALKVAELTAETEAGSAGISPNVPAVQPPHTLQPYQQPTLDFKSPQSIQSPPQGLTYVSPQEVVSGAHMPKPVAPVTLPTATPQAGGSHSLPGISQQFPYAVDPHAGVINPGSVHQPDFIQPTAPFQTQVQHPPLHLTTGISLVPVPRVMAQPPVSITQQLSHQGQATPTAPASFAVGHPQALQSQPLQQQVHPLSTATVPVVPSHGATYMPLTALKADLQPLLTPGTTLTQVSSKSSQLEDAQKLLLQHQGLLALPRLAGAAGGAGASEVSVAAGTLAHMGMSAEASAFMAAAAAGLRSQHAEGEDDSSSGASVVAIDNKIEQAMDLVKSHLMYAVREEVEVLKEQIKELIERNNQLEQENNLLKNLASPEQMAQFQAQVQTGDSPTGAGQPPVLLPAGSTQVLPSSQIPSSSA
ncbi:TSC22 domain family protein 1 isoform X1 [Solea solea]|uniref:TSC22 domain family protein 1 isoform X1 n=1 Tax=Solea solea TaxID=90069 RepID=UPI00272D25CE|nr:TSC22 domain family protein 1 isoform X1 [Solea solea]